VQTSIDRLLPSARVHATVGKQQLEPQLCTEINSLLTGGFETESNTHETAR